MHTLRYIGPVVLVAGTLSGCTAALTAASVAVGVVQIAQVAAGSSSSGAAGTKQQPSLFSWLSRFTAPKRQLAQLDYTPSELCLSRIPQPPGEAAKMSLAVLATPGKPSSGSPSALATGNGITSTKYVVPDKERPASRCEVRLVCLPNATHPAPMWVCPDGEVSPEAPAKGQTATTLGSGNPTAWAWSATEPLVAAPRTTTAIATASSVSGTEGTGVAAADGATPAAAATAPSGTTADIAASDGIPLVERGTRIAGKLRAPTDEEGTGAAEPAAADASASTGSAVAPAEDAPAVPLVERGTRVAGKLRAPTDEEGTGAAEPTTADSSASTGSAVAPAEAAPAVPLVGPGTRVAGKLRPAFTAAVETTQEGGSRRLTE